MAAVNAELPTVFTYLDYRAYLRSWFDVRQEVTPGYTWSRFARMAGCSPSHLHNVLQGERDLLPPYVEGFCRALKLQFEEAEFFNLLVRYQQSGTLLERAQVLQQIAGILRFQEAHPLEGAAFLCMSRLTHLALYELAFLPEFREDPAWIGEALSIHPSEAESALDALKSAGLLVTQPGGGVLRPAHAFLATAEEVAEPVMVLLYEQAMEAAQAAVSGPAEDRTFFATVGAIHDDEVPRFRAAVDGFHRRANAVLADLQAEGTAGNGPAPDVVYTVQVQLLPVTRVLGAEDDVEAA
jgi:uncharacterized protein (TIGR02147 family)